MAQPLRTFLLAPGQLESRWPIQMSLPSARDINPIPDDLDGKVAEEHFLGKSLEEAVKLFEDNFLYFQEDLLFMGAPAFRFYLEAAIQYAESQEAKYCAEDARLLLMVLRHRWEYEPDELAPVRDSLLEYCRGVIDRIPHTDVDPAIDGNLEAEYRSFLAQLEAA
jgi:hypothetical protein